MEFGRLFQNRNGFGNCFFYGLLAVFIHLRLVALAVCQTAGAADASARTRHPFNEIKISLFVKVKSMKLMINFEQNGERKLFPAESATQMGAPRLFLAEGLKGGVNHGVPNHDWFP